MLPILWQTIIATLFVLSFYYYKVPQRLKAKHRDDYEVVLFRIKRISLLSLLCYILCFYAELRQQDASISKAFYSTNEKLGLNFSMHSLLQTLYSLARVLILFSGPIIESLLERYNFIDTLYYYEEDEEDGSEPWHIILRNYLFAPFYEEFIFRSCFHYINSESMILSQILFGLSHIHHHVLSSNATIRQRLQGCILQFTYTTLFGIYTFYLFKQPSTTHEKNLWEIVAVHSLCNYLGFPSFIVLQDYLNQKTSPILLVTVVMLLYFTGPIAFYLLHHY